MSKLKTYFEKSVHAIKMGWAYVSVVPVLFKAWLQRMRGDGFYDITFIKVGRKWYCEVPGFPKELFDHTMMVGGAAKLLEYYSRGDERITLTCKVASEREAQHYCGMQLALDSSTLTGGAFYKGGIDGEVWLCPVTLFMLGRYPKHILIYRIHKNSLMCPICFE